MATSQSEARAKVSLDSGPFETAAKAISDAAISMSKAITTAMATAGVALLAVFGAKTLSGIVDSMKGVIDLGEEMANAGHKANIAAGQFYLFNRAVEKGLSFETVSGLLGENAKVLNESANVFRDVALKLWVVGEKIRGFWLGLMDRLAPVLSRLLDGALAQNLVTAGQAFGDAVAESAEVIYQLATDGQLWDAFKLGFKIVFEYAGERLLWLAGLGYDLIKLMMSSSMKDGINAAVAALTPSMKAFSEDFGKQLTFSFLGFFNKVLDAVDGLMTTIDVKLASLHLLSGEKLVANEVERSKQSGARNAAHDALGGFIGAGKDPVDSAAEFAKKVATIFSSSTFKPSEDLSEDIGKFSELITGALSRYGQSTKDNPTTTFENNSRRAAFGVDSLASIGGGGNVSLGLSVLNIQKSQLRALESIDAKISAGRESVYVSPIKPAPQGVSRAQTSSPVPP